MRSSIYTKDESIRKILLSVMFRMMIIQVMWILKAVNGALLALFDFLNWFFSVPAQRPKYEKIDGYMRVINKNSRGSVLAKDVSSYKVKGRTILKFPLTKTWEDGTIGARKFQLGNPSVCETDKNILLIGEQSCRKRLFIDSLANQGLGITWEDNFSIEVTSHSIRDEESKTQMIDIYTIPSTTITKMHFTVNVINIPNFTQDQTAADFDTVLDQLRKLLQNPSSHGIDSLHAMVFMCHATFQTLPGLYKHVYQYLGHLFDQSLEENTHNFLASTVGEGDWSASLTSLMSTAGMPQKTNYPFYFVSFFDEEVILSEAKLKGTWDDMHKELDDFLGKLEAAKPLSLTLSPENLDKRNRATEGLQQLHSLIRVACQQICNAKTEVERVQKEAKGLIYISELKDFKFDIYRATKTKRDLAYSGDTVTNCSVCFVTCHDHCKVKEDDQKAKCSSMNKTTGTCKVCPGRCYWDKHYNRDFVIFVTIEKAQVSLSDIAKRYGLDETKKIPDLVHALHKDIKAKEASVMEYIKQTTNNLRVIRALSGRSAKVTHWKSLQEVILGEERDELDGWRERIDLLQSLKQRWKWG